MNKIKYEKMVDEKLAMLKEELIKELMQEFEEESKDEFPKNRETYWYIASNGEINWDKWNNMETDKERLETGNVFKTIKEAEFEIEKLKVIAELKKYAEPKDRKWDGDNKHCSIGYDYSRQDIDYCICYTTKYDEIYFESVEKAREAIETIGQDKIKKYYLGVE